MNPVTANAFFDELTKIGAAGSGIGALVFPTTDQVPSSDDGVAGKRSDRAANATTVTSQDANPDTDAPAPEEQNG